MAIKLTYATKNTHKLSSACHALVDYDIELVGIDESLPEVMEIQAAEQAEVALDKARKYHKLLQRPLIVMDSGLFVVSLGGFPGVYTKDAIQKVGAGNIAKLLKPDAAHAYTQRTVVYFDGAVQQIFTSKVHGELIQTPRGDNGRDASRIGRHIKASPFPRSIAESAKCRPTGGTCRPTAPAPPDALP